MDESWRMRMGMPSLTRRRSTEDTSADRIRNLFGGADAADAVHPGDFSDVFGGPPRSVLSQQYSAARSRSRSNSFYEDIFRPPEDAAPAKTGRILPVFSIPASRSRRSEGFYSDIFGSDDDRRSRSRSKVNSKSTNSSSVLSSEELSPLRPVFGDDVASSPSASSKLRPINVPFRWSSATMMEEKEHHQKKQDIPAFPCARPVLFEDRYVESDCNEYYGSSSFGFSRQVTSPETISIEPSSYRSIKVPVEDLEMNSPSSVVSSICQDTEARAEVQGCVLQEEMGKEEDEVMSSYVIEINSERSRERCGEADAIDEAIAWAKERFQRVSPKREWNTRQCDNGLLSETEVGPSTHEFSDGQVGGHGSVQSRQENDRNKWTAATQKEQPEKDKMQKELELLDEDIKLWSAGKEANIRLLLSTLHHILSPNSGWYPVPLTNLIENTHVKKAYQKARLCLHPDKLQQRGATLPQKHVSVKAFSILQDAWGAFITQDVFFS